MLQKRRIKEAVTESVKTVFLPSTKDLYTSYYICKHMDATVAVRIDKRKLAEIKAISKEENRKNSEVLREALDIGLKEKKLAIALERYKSNEISVGRAAELADMPLSTFLDFLRARNVPFNYTVRELMEDFEGFL